MLGEGESGDHKYFTTLLSVRKKKESNEWVGSKLLSYRSANLDRGIK